MPLGVLDRRRDEIARAWLARSVREGALAEPGRREAKRMSEQVAELVSELAAWAEAGPFAEREREFPRAVAILRRIRPLGADPAGVADDLARLQSVMVQALAEVAREADAGTVLRFVDRLTRAVGDLVAEAVSVSVAERSRELEALAETDPLTGLVNVRGLRRELTRLVEIQERYGHPFGVLVLDLDGLKQVNDAFGHSAGDELLAAVAGVLRQATRSVDTVARMGGDEFCVLAPDQEAAGARSLGERLAVGVRALPRPLGTRIGASIGVAACPEHATDARTLLQLADAAMYQAKCTQDPVAVVGRVALERVASARRAS